MQFKQINKKNQEEIENLLVKISFFTYIQVV